MKHQWKRGHNGRFWNVNEIKELKFQRQPISHDEVEQWASLGYDHVKSFTGTMYDSRNPMPEWVNRFESIFGYRYSNFTYTFYRMATLEIMPTHVDHYTRYMALTGAEYKNVRRIIVMLEDWKPGHYLEIDGTGIVNWIAGDWFMWSADCPHAASNIGVEDRYTLQITCEEKEDNIEYDPDKIWKNIHWYNIPGLRSIKESSSPYMNRVVKSINNMDGKPWMVYMYNENIDKLENMFHPDVTIDYLNEHGLDIFLYEPLCSYKKGAVQLFPPKGTKHSMWFYSEFKGKEDPDAMRADELDSISKYIKNNNLTNVTVRTCDYNVSTQYPFYTNMKLVADDLFIKTIVPLKTESPASRFDFNRRFMCLNWRYTPHRHLMAAFMSTMDSYVSWYFRSDLFTISKSPWYNIFEWNQINPNAYNRIAKGIEILNNKAPMNVDLQINEAVTITDRYFMDNWPKKPDESGMLSPSITNPQTNSLEDFYNDIFCDIVTESRFAQPTGNYSEKTYQPMFYMKPFILVAPPFTLKAIKEEGFRTFSEFWDESYDDCENHEERMFKIFEIIDMLNDKPLDELREMYGKMTEILLHNRRLLDKKIAPL